MLTATLAACVQSDANNNIVASDQSCAVNNPSLAREILLPHDLYDAAFDYSTHKSPSHRKDSTREAIKIKFYTKDIRQNVYLQSAIHLNFSLIGNILVNLLCTLHSIHARM